jgi:hypothetical protein
MTSLHRSLAGGILLFLLSFVPIARAAPINNFLLDVMPGSNLIIDNQFTSLLTGFITLQSNLTPVNGIITFDVTSVQISGTAPGTAPPHEIGAFTFVQDPTEPSFMMVDTKITSGNNAVLSIDVFSVSDVDFGFGQLTWDGFVDLSNLSNIPSTELTLRPVLFPHTFEPPPNPLSQIAISDGFYEFADIVLAAISPIPEPPTLTLLSSCVLCLLGYGCYRSITAGRKV